MPLGCEGLCPTHQVSTEQQQAKTTSLAKLTRSRENICLDNAIFTDASLISDRHACWAEARQKSQQEDKVACTVSHHCLPAHLCTHQSRPALHQSGDCACCLLNTTFCIIPVHTPGHWMQGSPSEQRCGPYSMPTERTEAQARLYNLQLKKQVQDLDKHEVKLDVVLSLAVWNKAHCLEQGVVPAQKCE